MNFATKNEKFVSWFDTKANINISSKIAYPNYMNAVALIVLASMMKNYPKIFFIFGNYGEPVALDLILE